MAKPGPAAARDEVRTPLALLLVVTAVRLIYLQYTPLNLGAEEAQYWLWAQSPDLGYFSGAPLIAWLVRAATNVCGNGEACVRVASPLLHFLTALIVGQIGQELGGQRAGFWSAIGYATLPAVFVSAAFIGPEAPLLFFWAVAVLALLRLFATGLWLWAGVAGVAAGAGFLSHYAMLCILPAVAIFLARSRTRRWRQLAASLAIAALIAAPHLWWLAAYGIHASVPAHDIGPLEFLAVQVGMFGLVLSGALIWGLRRVAPTEPERLLLAAAVPAPVAGLALSVLAPGGIGWTAIAFVALTPLVTVWLLRSGSRQWIAGSVVLNCAVAALAAAALAGDTLWRQRGGCGFAAIDPSLGWERIGPEVARRLQAAPGTQVLSDDSDALSRIIYYARLEPGQFAKWNPREKPDDFYAAAGPVFVYPGATWLLASIGAPDDIRARFETAAPSGRLTVPLSVCRARAVGFYDLEGFRGY